MADIYQKNINSCATCTNAVTKSEDDKTTRWLNERGLAFCRAYSKRLKRRFLIPLQNAAGMVCGGRDYEAVAQASLI